jgi:hypothetical protein
VSISVLTDDGYPDFSISDNKLHYSDNPDIACIWLGKKSHCINEKVVIEYD